MLNMALRMEDAGVNVWNASKKRRTTDMKDVHG